MKLVRLVLFSAASLFVIASLIGFLLPSHVLVSRAVDISAGKDSIIPYLKDIRQWSAWMDGMAQAEVNIASSTEANLAGTMVKITAETDSTIVSEWISKNSSVQLSTVRLIPDTLHRQTIVQWQFEQQLKWYPWERLGSMMNDKILGTMMEKNLNNLKSIVEKK